MKKFVSVLAVILLIAFSVMPAYAAESDVDIESPTGSLVYHVYVIPSEGGTGKWNFTSEIDENLEQGVHLVPVAYEGYTFDHWELKGRYRVNDQDFRIVNLGPLDTIEGLRNINPADTSKYIKGEFDLVIFSDLYCYPYYVKNGEPATKPVNPDNDKTSPKTGTNPVIYIIAGTSVLALALTSLIVVKKAGKNK